MVFAAMGSLYQDSLGMVTALYELAFSAALSLGPLMGGFLYDVEGFYLPFTVAGQHLHRVAQKILMVFKLPILSIVLVNRVLIMGRMHK